MDDAQYTHIRYRNETGRGSFNWRMAFQFQYNSTERKVRSTEIIIIHTHFKLSMDIVQQRALGSTLEHAENYIFTPH